jgi:hypothetical protein
MGSRLCPEQALSEDEMTIETSGFGQGLLAQFAADMRPAAKVMPQGADCAGGQNQQHYR